MRRKDIKVYIVLVEGLILGATYSELTISRALESCCFMVIRRKGDLKLEIEMSEV